VLSPSLRSGGAAAVAAQQAVGAELQAGVRACRCLGVGAQEG